MLSLWQVGTDFGLQTDIGITDGIKKERKDLFTVEDCMDGLLLIVYLKWWCKHA